MGRRSEDECTAGFGISSSIVEAGTFGVEKNYAGIGASDESVCTSMGEKRFRIVVGVRRNEAFDRVNGGRCLVAEAPDKASCELMENMMATLVLRAFD